MVQNNLRVRAGERSGFPRFKPVSRFRTLTCDNNAQARQMVKIESGGKGTIRVKGLPTLKFQASRELPPAGHLAEFRITRTPKRVEAQFVFRMEVDVPAPSDPPVRPVGLNVGVRLQVASHDGDLIVEGRREDTRRAKRLQRKVSRGQRGSNSRRKKVRSLAKEIQYQAERRKGESHELSARLVKRHDFIAVEDLNIQRMTASARGTQESPGENVALKAGLNRAILDQAWGDLIAKIQYKAESAGVGFVKVDPAYTTQDCSLCGLRVPKLLGARYHRCPQCRVRLLRAVNAARNVLRLGLASAAGGKLAGAQEGSLLTEADGPGLRGNT